MVDNKNIVDNYVEIGDFYDGTVHMCHFWKIQKADKII